MVADGVNLARVLGRLEGAALSPSTCRPPAPLSSLLAEPFDRFEPPTVDQALAAVLAPADAPATQPAPAPARSSQPIGRPPQATPAQRSAADPVDGGRTPAPRRRTLANTTASTSSRPRRPAAEAEAGATADRSGPSPDHHPQPAWRSVPPIRAGSGGGHRDQANRHRGPVVEVGAASRPSTTQLRRWADTGPATTSPGPASPSHRVGPSQPGTIETGTDPMPATPAAPSARPAGDGTGSRPAPTPPSTPTTTNRSAAPTSNPAHTPGRTGGQPDSGSATPARRSLSLRTLGPAWQEQAAGPTPTGEPPPSVGRPDGDALLPVLTSPPTPTRSLDQVAELAGSDVDLESTLLTMLERGLRAEARRYGVDLEGWEIQ